MTLPAGPGGVRIGVDLEALTPPQAALMAYGERKRSRRSRAARDVEPGVAEICEHGAYLSTVGIGPLRKRGAWRFRWSWVRVAIPALVTAALVVWAQQTDGWENLDLVGGTAFIITALLVTTLPRDGAIDLKTMAGRNAVMLTDDHLILRRPDSATCIPRHLVAGTLVREETRRAGSSRGSDDNPSLPRSGKVAELVLRLFDDGVAREVVVASAVGDQSIVGFVGKGSAFGHLESFREVLKRWQDGAATQDLAEPAPSSSDAHAPGR